MDKKVVTAGQKLGATGFMRDIPHEIRRRLIDSGQRYHYSKGQIIQQRGDAGTEFWYIETGTVQIGRYSVDGGLTLFALLGPGESFGEQAFLGEFPRMVDAIAGSDCMLIRIGEAELQNLINEQPNVARILLKAMAHTLQQAFDMIEEGRRLTTEQRLAQVLLRLCGDGVDLQVPVTQQELADLVGVSRVSLGKALGVLEQRALVKRSYGKVMITDRAALIEAGLD